MNESSRTRKTAGINRKLDDNYLWPKNFGESRLDMDDKAKEPKGDIPDGEDISEVHVMVNNSPSISQHTIQNRSNVSSRHSTHTKYSRTSRTSVGLQRLKVVLEAEKSKQVLLEESLKEKLKLIELEKTIREAEILEQEEQQSQVSSRHTECSKENVIVNTHNSLINSKEQEFLNKSQIAQWIDQIPTTFEESDLRSPQGIDYYDEQTMATQNNPTRSTKSSKNEPVIQMTTDHIDKICQIMKNNCDNSTIVSRYGKNMNLPIFDGNPEEWPIFYDQFKRSTQIYNICDEENIIRLQKCLRGRAREAVNSLLISSSNVSKVIETLKVTFGRPEFIISMLVEKVRKATPPREGRFETYLPFSNIIENLVTTMELFNNVGHMNNPQLLSEVIVKLPPFLRLEWAKVTMSKTNVSLKEFSVWFRNIALAASTCTNANVLDKRPNEPDHSETRKKKENIFSTSKVDGEKKPICPCKEKYHPVEECDVFKKMTVDEKWTYITSQKLCFSCLKPAHSILKCRKKKKCEISGCAKFHHKILHNQDRVINCTVQPGPSTVLSSTEKQHQVETIHHIRENETRILLRIIPVKIGNDGKQILTYALFDEAATTTLIDESIAGELDLHGPVEPLCYQWLNEVSRSQDNSRKVSFNISGTDEGSRTFKIVGARTVKDLCLPRQTINVEHLSKLYPYLNQATVSSFLDAQPMILLGQDQCALTIARKFYHGTSWNTPFVSKTLLGWVIHGKSQQKNNLNRSLIFHLCCGSQQELDDEIHNLVKDSFRIENFGVQPVEENGRSKEDERALTIMKNTIKQVGTHFEIGLLWKNEEAILPDSKNVALNRLKCTERKTDKNSDFAKQYCAKIDEYLEKKYIRKLNPEEVECGNPRTWYLPHFGVVNPNKPGKLRLILDAAAKSDGISLNDLLLQGPDMLTNLTAILWKFRQKEIAFCGDIKEMFHQVWIRDEDCSAQRFFWRGMERSKSPDVYQMKVMTFGATSSPCMAQFVKNQNARNHITEFPKAAISIMDKHYVDDYLESTDTEKEAIDLISEVIEVHRRGGFEICNWISNSKNVLKSIPESLRSKSQKNLDSFCQQHEERILGLWWNPETDKFKFFFNCHKVNPGVMNCTRIPTKREVLKLAMSFFDPLGLLSPMIVKFKIFMQQIWRLGIGWDNTITPEMEPKWFSLIEELKMIETISIPRCYGPNLFQSSHVELHGFCDSSEQAFSAVVYLRFGTKNVHVSFVSAKTRVAPLKPITIPKLEVQGAVMLSRLVNTIRTSLEVQITSIYLWTDSTTVLYWIRSEEKRFKTFVSHRVNEITELTDVSSWYWIPGEQNVADESTREISKNPDRWLDGPKFLQLPKEKWPKEKWPRETEWNLNEDLEIKKERLLLTIQIDDYLPDTQRFSKYVRLIRTTAWMIRFLNNCRAEKKTYMDLEIDEIKKAEGIWLKHVQNQCFAEEIADLEINRAIDKTSKLYTLHPMLDENGILRIQGRLQNSDDLDYFQKHPVILDPHHRFTKLLIEDYHVRFCHQGQELVMNEIRQKYWILRLRNAVRKCKNDCFYCKKLKAKPQVPEMGQLPEYRLKSFIRPFTITGMDYFGPVSVTIGRRHEKRYVVLFTCMSMRAIHLEIAASLNTDSAIMAIRRFIGRRGCPQEIHSDNGTNLHAADKELKIALNELNKDKLSLFLTSRNIKWQYIPAASPHMGGSWERLIKSVKNVLRVTLKEKSPREEVLQTLLVEAENMVNSRPLTYVSSDHADPESLTPNHFLLSSSDGAAPLPGKFNENLIHLRRQWKVSQALADIFWKRWVKEYLPIMNKISKWHQKVPNIGVNDVVIVIDDTTPRNNWPLGIIQRVYTGKDGKVRVVDVKLKNGTFRRPVTKVCKLPGVRKNEEEEQNSNE